MSVERGAPEIPAFPAACRTWARIGLLSFGGPAGQIALMHRVIVDEKRWVGDRRFLHALNFCTLLPGPEAQQLATYLGWLMHGVRGGVAAGLLFILPGALVMLALSLLFVMLGSVPLVGGIFFGLKCAVLALVAGALRRIASRALVGLPAMVLAGAAFASLFFLHLPFPLVVLGAAAVGLLWPTAFSTQRHGTGEEGPPAAIDLMLAADPGRVGRESARARRAGLVAVASWLLPVALLVLFADGTFADIAVFFSKMAVVTFGGAYAVLAYVAQDAVGAHGWLSSSEMLTGLGLAETTPGPLILVLQFVGFLAGYRADAGTLSITGGILGAVLTLWVTFAPCFAFVFLGAPVIEKLQGNRALAGALAAITAAIVGVIGNLALWFALGVLFRETREAAFGPFVVDLPVPGSLDPAALFLSALAAVALLRWRLGTLAVLGLAALAGLGLGLAG